MSEWIKCSERLPEKSGTYMTVDMDDEYQYMYPKGKTMEQRLIDADALIKWINGTGCFMDVFKRVTTDIINKQPTVIAAERKDDEQED